jgi:hypothetical protein
MCKNHPQFNLVFQKRCKMMDVWLSHYSKFVFHLEYFWVLGRGREFGMSLRKWSWETEYRTAVAYGEALFCLSNARVDATLMFFFLFFLHKQ